MGDETASEDYFMLDGGGCPGRFTPVGVLGPSIHIAKHVLGFSSNSFSLPLAAWSFAWALSIKS
jgi:hypothetical protein